MLDKPRSTMQVLCTCFCGQYLGTEASYSVTVFLKDFSKADLQNYASPQAPSHKKILLIPSALTWPQRNISLISRITAWKWMRILTGCDSLGHGSGTVLISRSSLFFHKTTQESYIYHAIETSMVLMSISSLTCLHIRR